MEQGSAAVGRRCTGNLAVIGGTCIGIAEGSGGRQSLQQRVGDIYLCGMRKALACQVLYGEGIFATCSVGIDEELMIEVRIVIVGIDLQVLARDGQTERGGDTRVPCLFLLKFFCSEERLSTGQQ